LTSSFPGKHIRQGLEGTGEKGDRLRRPRRAGGDDPRGQDAPLRVSGDNEPVPTDKVDAYLMPKRSPPSRASVFQTVLDGKWDFLDGVVSSITNESKPPNGRQLAGL